MLCAAQTATQTAACSLCGCDLLGLISLTFSTTPGSVLLLLLMMMPSGQVRFGSTHLDSLPVPRLLRPINNHVGLLLLVDLALVHGLLQGAWPPHTGSVRVCWWIHILKTCKQAPSKRQGAQQRKFPLVGKLGTGGMCVWWGKGGGLPKTPYGNKLSLWTCLPQHNWPCHQ